MPRCALRGWPSGLLLLLAAFPTAAHATGGPASALSGLGGLWLLVAVVLLLTFSALSCWFFFRRIRDSRKRWWLLLLMLLGSAVAAAIGTPLLIYPVLLLLMSGALIYLPLLVAGLLVLVTLRLAWKRRSRITKSAAGAATLTLLAQPFLYSALLADASRKGMSVDLLGPEIAGLGLVFVAVLFGVLFALTCAILGWRASKAPA